MQASASCRPCPCRRQPPCCCPHTPQPHLLQPRLPSSADDPHVPVSAFRTGRQRVRSRWRVAGGAVRSRTRVGRVRHTAEGARAHLGRRHELRCGGGQQDGAWGGGDGSDCNCDAGHKDDDFVTANRTHVICNAPDVAFHAAHLLFSIWSNACCMVRSHPNCSTSSTIRRSLSSSTNMTHVQAPAPSPPLAPPPHPRYLPPPTPPPPPCAIIRH